MITTYGGDWSKCLCNGCYGRLLALYEVKAGSSSHDERAEALAAALLVAVGLDEQRQAQRLFLASENRASRLAPEALRFISTAEHVAAQLQDAPQLEWSPAVIGLCKAVEVEVAVRILLPLAAGMRNIDLAQDKADKDVGRVAAYCKDPGRKPPELGAFAHFLQMSIHSEARRSTSALIGGFLRLLAGWTGANWILDPNGFHAALVMLTTQFRNRAAHIDELAKADYVSCRELTIGPQGMIWRLLIATDPHK